MIIVTFWDPVLSPPQRLPLGIPIKKKIESARGKMGRGKGREPLFSLPLSHRAPRSLFFFLPSLPTTQKPPHNTKRPLRRREDPVATVDLLVERNNVENRVKSRAVHFA